MTQGKSKTTKKGRPVLLLLMLAVLLAAFALGFFLLHGGKPVRPAEEGASLSVCFIDVGQGNCVLICGPEKTVLIDAGPTESAGAVLACLHEAGVEKLDLAVLTHPHIDHYGGFARVLRAVDTQELWIPELPAELTPTTVSFEKLLGTLQERKIPLICAGAGRTADLGGGAVLTVVWAGVYENLNDCSLVCRLDFGESSFLFTGDIEEAAQRDMLEADAQLDAQVLSVPHHGSASSADADFLREVSPEYAVVQCGAGNDYGHPHAQMLELYGKRGIRVLRSDLDGDIVFFSDGKTITVQTEKQ